MQVRWGRLHDVPSIKTEVELNGCRAHRDFKARVRAGHLHRERDALPGCGHQGCRAIAPRQRLLPGNVHALCETVARLGRLLLIALRLGFPLGFELSGQLP